MVEAAFGIRHERPARICKFNILRIPVEQYRADAILELFELLSECGLRNAKPGVDEYLAELGSQSLRRTAASLRLLVLDEAFVI